MLKSDPNSNLSVPGTTSGKPEDSAEMDSAIDFVLQHLQHESEYLDNVIQCSLKMKDLLQQRDDLHKQEENNNATPANGSAGSNGKPHDELNQMRGNLERQFAPVLEGRQQMKTALQVFQPLIDNPPTVSVLARNIDEPARSDLKRLRDEIKHKLNEVRAITMGNQAVLIYTMEFYNRLLTGLSGESTPAKAYNADGKVASQLSSSMLRKDC